MTAILFVQSCLFLWCSIAMKIRMNEMTPEGKILNCGVVIIGKTAREIVQGMMRDNPYMNDKTETAPLWGSRCPGSVNPINGSRTNQFATVKTFLRVLRNRCLTTEIEDDLLVPITNVKVRLIGEDGNAFAIQDRCGAVMREADYLQSFVDAFVTEAKSDNCDDLLITVMRYGVE